MKFMKSNPLSTETVASQRELMQIIAQWSPEERATKEKALVRKVDIRLLPILVRCDNSGP